jgi:hypothetical protein
MASNSNLVRDEQINSNAALIYNKMSFYSKLRSKDDLYDYLSIKCKVNVASNQFKLSKLSGRTRNDTRKRR